MKKVALIVAGGSGKRMENEIPKQFIELAGKPILIHTINQFWQYDNTLEIIVVLPNSQIKTWEDLCGKYNFRLEHKVCPGGKTRFHSVKNGLSIIEGTGIVFIHDGVRPLVNKNTLERCLQMATNKGNAIPVVPLTESIRKTENEENWAVDRNQYKIIQTPQTFQIDKIKKAYQQDYSPTFTDDASVLEAWGDKINLVEGNTENIKITYPQDIFLANQLLNL